MQEIPTSIKWKLWFKGLIAAIISTSASGVSGFLGSQIFGERLELNQIMAGAIGAGIAGAALYLAKSPLPNGEYKVPRRNTRNHGNRL